MSKAKKGPAKKAGKKGRGKSPMKPSYMAAKKPSAAKSAPAPKREALSVEERVKWLLDKAAANGWGTPYDE